MNKTLGQVAFEAYKEAVEGVAYDGTAIPEWKEVADHIKLAWQIAAMAVIDHGWNNSTEEELEVEVDLEDA